MKIKVIALAPNDGWAYIERENKITLLRPPYTPSNQVEVSMKDVKDAIELYGFEKCVFTANTIEEVIKFLEQQYFKSNELEILELPSLEQLKEFLEDAPDDVLFKYIEKAQKELIPKGELEIAKSIALDLLSFEKVKQNPKMHAMATEIIERVKITKEKENAQKIIPFKAYERLDHVLANVVISDEISKEKLNQLIVDLREDKDVRDADITKSFIDPATLEQVIILVISTVLIQKMLDKGV
ncbi:MAG: hypothetical protein ACFFC7_29820, partial [Candidatus Hermodarchaeota archaeon]